MTRWTRALALAALALTACPPPRVPGGEGSPHHERLYSTAFEDFLVRLMGPNQELTFNVLLSSRPVAATFEVRMSPDGAQRIGTTYQILRGLPRGRYRFRVRFDGYRPCTGEFDAATMRVSVLLAALVRSADPRAESFCWVR